MPATGAEPQVIGAHVSALPATGEPGMDENQVPGTEVGPQVTGSVHL